MAKFEMKTVNERIGALKQALKKGVEAIGSKKVTAKAPAAKVAKAAARPAKATGGAKVAKAAKSKARKVAKAPKVATARATEPLAELLAQHPRKDELVRAGALKDQLLRALIPLYLSRQSELEVNSGATSRFWKAHGVTFASPNAAKALREHVGYAKATKAGRKITPNGIKYVEAALSGRKAA